MADDPNKYNFPYRTNYEFLIIIVWFIAGAACIALPYIIELPKLVYTSVGVACFPLGCVLGRNGIEIYIRKSRLKGYPLEFIDPNSPSTLKLFGITDKEVIKNVQKQRR